MKWIKRGNKLESVDHYYIIEEKNNSFQLYLYGFFSDHEIIDESNDIEELKKKANNHRLNEKRKITCIHCGKKKNNHRASDMACPTGSSGKIGYTSFSNTKFFEPKVK